MTSNSLRDRRKTVAQKSRTQIEYRGARPPQARCKQAPSRWRLERENAATAQLADQQFACRIKREVNRTVEDADAGRDLSAWRDERDAIATRLRHVQVALRVDIDDMRAEQTACDPPGLAIPGHLGNAAVGLLDHQQIGRRQEEQPARPTQIFRHHLDVCQLERGSGRSERGRTLVCTTSSNCWSEALL